MHVIRHVIQHKHACHTARVAYGSPSAWLEVSAAKVALRRGGNNDVRSHARPTDARRGLQMPCVAYRCQPTDASAAAALSTGCCTRCQSAKSKPRCNPGPSAMCVGGGMGVARACVCACVCMCVCVCVGQHPPVLSLNPILLQLIVHSARGARPAFTTKGDQRRASDRALETPVIDNSKIDGEPACEDMETQSDPSGCVAVYKSVRCTLLDHAAASPLVLADSRIVPRGLFTHTAHCTLLQCTMYTALFPHLACGRLRIAVHLAVLGS